MRVGIFAAVFGLVLAGMSAVAAPLPTATISIVAKQAGARDVIKNLLDQSGLRYELPRTLSNDKKLSIMAKNAAWADVFNNAIDDAGYRYEIGKDGTLRLVQRK